MQMIIESTLAHMRRLLLGAWASLPIGAGHACCLCGRKIQRFLPYRGTWPSMPAVITTTGIVGSDIQNFECPACGCHDRERHLFFYLQASGVFELLSGARILHLAPERHLQARIARTAPAEYVLGDLYPSRPGVLRIDLMGIDFPDARFDVVIANHVLEHVADDACALREIHRVLRPGGLAILQTPYASRLPNKREDAAIRSEEERLQAYGQEDHCRLYGADFAHFVSSFGFLSKVRTHAELLPHIDAGRMGVNAQEPFLLFAKPGA